MLFEPGFKTLFSAWAQPEYSHGPLSVAIFFFLLLLIEAEPRQGQAYYATIVIGASILVMALAAAVAADFFRLGEFSAWAFVFAIYGAHLSCSVPQRIGQLSLVYFSVLLALPLPVELFWQIQFLLQKVTAVASVALAGLLAVPVELKNNIIDVNGLFLHVAQACSGFRYILPLWSFAAVLAVVAKVPWAVKLMLATVAAPIAVCMNVLRVTIIIIVVYLRDSISHVTGFAHFLEGWLIFGVSVALLFWLLRGALTRSGWTAPLAECMDCDAEKVKRGAKNVLKYASPLRGAALCAPLSVAAMAAWSLTSAGAPLSPAQGAFPEQTGAWVKVRHWEDQTGGATTDDSVISQSVYVQDVPFEELEFARLSRAAEHDALELPTAFIQITEGWEIEAMDTYRLNLSTNETVKVAEVVLVGGFQRRIGIVWFENGCGSAASLVASKLIAIAKDIQTPRR
jgi:exosortase